MYCVVFFFKQKTAYEMRISDWSSDVCSSDLNGRDSFGASGGRALSFEDVPSELLAGVDVYKNPSAMMIEGGGGGLVNLRTRMPFDKTDDKLLVSGTVGLNYYDMLDDSRFNDPLDRKSTSLNSTH